MNRSMSRFAAGAATALAVVLVATSCSSSGENADDGTLNLYQSLSSTQIRPVIDGFTAFYKKETGEDIVITDFSKGAGELRSTIDLEARSKSTRADVVMTDIGEVRTLADKYPELFEAPAEDVLSDQALPDYVRERAKTTPSIIAALHPYVPVYNTDRVAPADVPKSWKDLLNDHWKDRIGLGDPETTSSAHAPLWFLSEYLQPDGPPFGFDYYADLGKLEPRVASQSDALMEYLSSGELDIAILGYSTALQAVNEGRPIAAVLPVEGAPALTSSVAVVANARQKTKAEMFAKWLLSDEGQAALNKGSAYLPVRRGVQVPAPPFPFDTASPKIVPVDAAWVAQNRESNIAEFQKLIK